MHKFLRIKKIHILDILEKNMLLNVLLRVSFDLKIITMEKYTHFIEQTDSIARQANGWMK